MFEPGEVYRRRDLHARFGGQNQGGISTPREYPYVFLFTGDSGEQYGYKDGWQPDGTYRYTGEGQLGDMQFLRGNKAIRDHQKDGRELHLFQKTEKKGYVRHLGQFELVDYDLIENVPDRMERPRTAIVFKLVPWNSGH